MLAESVLYGVIDHLFCDQYATMAQPAEVQHRLLSSFAWRYWRPRAHCAILNSRFIFFLIISCPHILRRAPVVCLWDPCSQSLPALLWKRIMGTFYPHNIINKSKCKLMWSIQLFPDALHPQLSPLYSLDKSHIFHADIVMPLFLALPYKSHLSYWI